MSLSDFVTATLLISLFRIKLRFFPAVTLVNPDAPLAALLPNIVSSNNDQDKLLFLS